MTIPLFHIGPPPPDEDAAAKAVDAALAEVTQTMSPAAQTILDAITLKRYDAPHYACPQDLDQIRSDAAAAMRAAADRLQGARTANNCIVRLYQFAAELDGQP